MTLTDVYVVIDVGHGFNRRLTTTLCFSAVLIQTFGSIV